MDGDIRRGRWTEMGDAVCPSTLSAFGDFGRGIGYFGPGIPGVGAGIERSIRPSVMEASVLFWDLTVSPYP